MVQRLGFRDELECGDPVFFCSTPKLFLASILPFGLWAQQIGWGSKSSFFFGLSDGRYLLQVRTSGFGRRIPRARFCRIFWAAHRAQLRVSRAPQSRIFIFPIGFLIIRSRPQLRRVCRIIHLFR